MVRFDEQVVVVTGAGRGLGRLYAEEFARRGASVVVNDLGGTMGGDGSDQRVADEVVAAITRSGGTAVASYDSVDTPEGGAAITAAAVDSFGRLDALVSNAGILHTAPFEDLTPDDWRRMRSVHFDGAFYVSQPAYRVMKAQGYGRFVFIASSAGLFGQPNSAHYAAVKAGVFGLTNTIAIEGEPFGIRANTVLPTGYSRMVSETVGDVRDATLDAYFEAIKPELVVPMVTYLASSACDVTHHNYSACAGRFARVFAGLAEGWSATPETTPSADDVAEHFATISNTEPYTVPSSIYDEVAQTWTRLGIS